MSVSVRGRRNWLLDVKQEWIDVTSTRPSPNERWMHADSNGHEHRYDRGFPTLELVVDESHWCDGHEGIAPHDPHEAVDRSHYECVMCREEIEPGFDPPFTPKRVPGSRSATLTGIRSDGAEVTVWLNEDDMRFLGAERSEDDITAMVDAMGNDRVMTLTYTGQSHPS